jgi:hypothetical protein
MAGIPVQAAHSLLRGTELRNGLDEWQILARFVSRCPGRHQHCPQRGRAGIHVAGQVSSPRAGITIERPLGSEPRRSLHSPQGQWRAWNLWQRSRAFSFHHLRPGPDRANRSVPIPCIKTQAWIVRPVSRRCMRVCCLSIEAHKGRGGHFAQPASRTFAPMQRLHFRAGRFFAECPSRRTGLADPDGAPRAPQALSAPPSPY